MDITFKRGNIEDCKHQVVFSLSNEQEEIAGSTKDQGSEALIYLRSAAKMIQALAMVQSGADQKFKLKEKHLALVCASHSGEEMHIDLVNEWLTLIGLSEKDFECGILEPINRDAACQLRCNGNKPDHRHHMCSGKHLGMLTLAKYNGWSIKNYHQESHEVQKTIKENIIKVSGKNEISKPALDGCNVPCWAMSTKDWAKTLARFCSDNKEWSPSAEKLLRAQIKYPLLIAGTGRLCSKLTLAAAGRFIVKSGADGVIVAVFPTEKKALVVKCLNGSDKVAQIAFTYLLSKMLKDFKIQDKELISHIKTASGEIAGQIIFKEEAPQSILTPAIF